MGVVFSCLTCSEEPKIELKGNYYSIVKLLGEGGFSYVYLVRDMATGKHYALKKLRCVFGGESVAAAMREVENCLLFRDHKEIVSSIDSQVKQEPDGTKTVYILLPYYSNGSLQDRINENIVDNSHFSTSEVVDLGIGVANALSIMHNASSNTGNSSDQPAINEGGSDQDQTDRLLQPELATTPYAHRDLKPANVMFDSGNNVVLMDLGSCSPARVHITTRKQAIEVQETAAEHCTLPYRAPELFDVRTGADLDEKVDVWGFGCTLYSMMYSVSPFEREEEVAGANINIAIARAKFSFPAEPEYPESLKQLIKQCLQIKSEDRPDINSVISSLQEI